MPNNTENRRTAPFEPGKILILDGATGSNLIAAGMPPGICPELWILDNAHALISLQREYVAAGSGALCAPTFGANRETLSRYGVTDRKAVADINRRLAALTLTAAGGRALVMGDISPVPLMLRPYGQASFEEAAEIYYEQASVLDGEGVDLFFIETQIALDLARAAFAGVRAASDKPIFASITIDESGKTMYGNETAAFLVVMQSLGAAAAGCNCSLGPDVMLPPLIDAAKYVSLPIIAKPNAGRPRADGGFDLDAAAFAVKMADAAAAGITVVGGCCGTTPGHIRALRDELEKRADIPYNANGPAAGVSTAAPGAGKRCGGPAVIAATDKRVFEIDPGAPSPEPIDAGELDAEELADEIYDAADAGPPFIHLRLSGPADALKIIEAAPALELPVMFSGPPDAVAAARRVYAGKPVEG